VRKEAITVVYVTHDQAEAMAVSDRIAVMREGRIAQLDTPEAIYRAPADSFVARFIGGFSLLSGYAGDGNFMAVESTVSIKVQSNARGESVLVIRPEDARPVDAHPESRLDGTVLSTTYQGRCWRVLVGIGAQKIRLDWPEAPRVGTQLSFSLPPDRSVVLAP
jgi:iron(III) transport system ATP-binding protein